VSLCKKHGKERDQVITSKPNGRSKHAIEFVGCVDCKAGLPATVTPADGGLATGKGAKRDAKRTPPEPTKKPVTPPKKEDAPPVKKSGGFLGFRL
jgi:hypothetical protein